MRVPVCCETHNCLTRRGDEIVIHQFLPGFMGPAQAELIMPPIKRSINEWEGVFKTYFDEEWPQTPQIVIFNAGLWLINAYRNDAPYELEKIITAWMNLCKHFQALFVWRSTFYHHRSTAMTRLIAESNTRAIKLITEKFNHYSYFLDSNFYMSMLR